MGTRGRGSLLSQNDRAEAQKIKTPLPWEKKGLGRAQKVIAFLEYLPVTKGIYVGRSMKLLPDQLEFIREVYGRKKADGRRQVSLAIKSEPKGNGKTGLCAGLALCHLMGPEAEPRGEIYSASIDGVHAGKMYAEMEAILIRRPALACRANAQRFRKSIQTLDGIGEGSIFEALSSDGRKAQGLSPSLWIYDELAQVEDRELLDNLLEGMSKRKEALGIIISTQASSDTHPLSQLIDDGLTGEDPSTYVHLIAAPPGSDPFDIEVLKSVNPAWGKFLDIDDLLKSLERARRIPAFEPGFRNLRLNQRVDAREEQRIVTRTVWDVGNVPVDRARLAGRDCWAALDLSGKHDLASLTLSFQDNGGMFDVLPFFWTPEGQLENRRKAEREQFKGWIDGGFIQAIPGPTVRFSFVASTLVALSKEFNIVVLGYDRWRIDDFKQDLADEDSTFSVPLQAFGQGFRDMGPAVEWFAELAVTGRIRHGGHPVLTAAVANAILVGDPAGNQKIDKDRSNGRGPVRIDGAVTMAMSLQLARTFEPVEDDSVALNDFLSNAVMR